VLVAAKLSYLTTSTDIRIFCVREPPRLLKIYDNYHDKHFVNYPYFMLDLVRRKTVLSCLQVP